MNAADMTFQVRTDLEKYPVSGMDSILVIPPPAVVPKVDGVSGVVVPAMERLIRRLSDEAAVQVGTILHHAVWTLTADLFTVARIGMNDDCPTCMDGTARAMDWMREHPGEDMLAGLLYWTKGLE